MNQSNTVIPMRSPISIYDKSKESSKEEPFNSYALAAKTSPLTNDAIFEGIHSKQKNRSSLQVDKPMLSNKGGLFQDRRLT